MSAVDVAATNGVTKVRGARGQKQWSASPSPRTLPTPEKYKSSGEGLESKMSRSTVTNA